MYFSVHSLLYSCVHLHVSTFFFCSPFSVGIHLAVLCLFVLSFSWFMSTSQAIHGLSFINVCSVFFCFLSFFWHVPHDIVLKDQNPLIGWQRGALWGLNRFLCRHVCTFLMCVFGVDGGHCKHPSSLISLLCFWARVCFALSSLNTPCVLVLNHLLIRLAVRPMFLWRMYWQVHVSLANVQ